MTDHPGGELRHVPIDQLYLHAMNPRQNGSADDAGAMARSIATAGLIQNLSGYEDPDSPGKIGIVAGGRRLAGLALMAKGLDMNGMSHPNAPDLQAIPVQVTSDHFLARAWAGAESATQKPLNAADEIRAYAAMADQGNSPEMIAYAFAQTERHVKGRLKLAGLRQETLDALRGGHISLDQAKALTIARDGEAELSVLTVVRGRNYGSEYIRGQLTEKMVRSDDRRVRFITLDLYRAEGGQEEPDLFADHSYLADEKLINRLFARELDARAEALRADLGFAWVKAAREPYVDYGETARYSKLRKTPGDLTEADAERYDELAELAESEVLDDDGQAELDDLQRRLDGDWTDEDREAGGIWVFVNRGGDLTIEGAYRKKKAGKASSTSPGGGGGSDSTPAAPKPPLTQAGHEVLKCIGLLALQESLIDRTEFVLDLFAWQLERGAPSYSSPFAIQLTDQRIAPEAEGAWHISEKLIGGSNETRFPDGDENPVASFEAFRDKGRKHRNAVLTRHILRTLQAPDGRMAPLARLMAEFAGTSVRRVWTPDAATYFSRLSAPAMEALWAELLELEAEDPRREEFAKLKKGQKAGELESLFADASVREAMGLSRDQAAAIDAWLPPELRAGQGVEE